MLTQTSWGLYIMQLCLWCLYGFINVFVGLLFEPPCVVLQDDGVQRVSQSLNTQWFVFLQVRNLTLAFQAAESIGIKPSLVSWSATDLTHTLITQRGHLIRQIGNSTLWFGKISGCEASEHRCPANCFTSWQSQASLSLLLSPSLLDCPEPVLLHREEH